MRAADALDPFHDDIDVALRDGVTAFLLAPRGENTLGGVCAVVKPGVDGRGARVVEDEVALKLSFAGHSLRGDRRPTSRAGAVALLREEMARARTDDGALELRKALDGEWPVLIDARDHGEIATALRTMKEFGLRGALVHASWASETADEIGATGASCIVGPLGPGDDRRVLEGPAALEAAGVKVAFGSDAPAGTRDALLVTAALAVRHGMSREGALRALTIHAAEIAGVPDLMGSIEAGKSADLLVIEGDPLDLSSRVHEVIIDGKTAFQRGKPKEAP